MRYQSGKVIDNLRLILGLLLKVRELSSWSMFFFCRAMLGHPTSIVSWSGHDGRKSIGEALGLGT